MPERKKVYLLSGLATDDRVFHKINLENAEVHVLHWIKPHPDETVQAYAARMADKITHEIPPILIGYSFGGIMAQEIARIIPVEKIILVASITEPQEMPWHLLLVKLSQLYKFLPSRPLAKIYPLSNFFFGTESAEERYMLREIINTADADILNWSIKQVLEWKGCPKTCPIYRIHGTHDRIFPIRSCKNVTPINKGTHLMMVSKAAAITPVLNKLIHQPETKNAS